ncbi:MAG: hypothetical protein WBP59_06875, partial [Ilumatobacteraceae bacterium]
MTVRRATRQTTDEQRIDVQRVDPSPVRRSSRPVAVGSVHDPAEAEADRLADRALAIAADYTVDADAGRAGHATPHGDIRRSESDAVDGLAVDRSALATARSGG